MKNRFSIFKNKALFCLVIALMFIALPLSAEESCCTCCCAPVSQCVNVQNNGGTVQQAEQEAECESELSENDEKDSFGTRLKRSFNDPINLIEGPLYMIGSPLFGIIVPCITNAFHDNSFWECVYNHVVGTPCWTLLVFSAGAAKTITLGKFSNIRIFVPVADFIMFD